MLLVLVVLVPMSASACTCVDPFAGIFQLERDDEGPPALLRGTVRWTPDGASIVFAVSTVEAGAVYVVTAGGVPVAEHVYADRWRFLAALEEKARDENLTGRLPACLRQIWALRH